MNHQLKLCLNRLNIVKKVLDNPQCKNQKFPPFLLYLAFLLKTISLQNVSRQTIVQKERSLEVFFFSQNVFSSKHLLTTRFRKNVSLLNDFLKTISDETFLSETFPTKRLRMICFQNFSHKNVFYPTIIKVHPFFSSKNIPHKSFPNKTFHRKK